MLSVSQHLPRFWDTGFNKINRVSTLLHLVGLLEEVNKEFLILMLTIPWHVPQGQLLDGFPPAKENMWFAQLTRSL